MSNNNSNGFPIKSSIKLGAQQSNNDNESWLPPHVRNGRVFGGPAPAAPAKKTLPATPASPVKKSPAPFVGPAYPGILGKHRQSRRSRRTRKVRR
jgi:hypothetical protein